MLQTSHPHACTNQQNFDKPQTLAPTNKNDSTVVYSHMWFTWNVYLSAENKLPHIYIYYEKQIVFPWKFADISPAMFTTFLSGHAGI